MVTFRFDLFQKVILRIIQNSTKITVKIKEIVKKFVCYFRAKYTKFQCYNLVVTDCNGKHEEIIESQLFIESRLMENINKHSKL